MKSTTITISFAFLCMSLFAQSRLGLTDTIIVLNEVSVFPQKGIRILQSDNRKGEIHIRIKGKSSFVTEVFVNPKNAYHIASLEFYFNYQWQGLGDEGFYVKPIVLKSDGGKPGCVLLDENTEYLVSKKINEYIHINILNSNLKISNVNSFFVGLEFTEKGNDCKFEDFNVTMVPSKKDQGVTYMRASCSECPYGSLDLDDKNELSLKYKIYYTP